MNKKEKMLGTSDSIIFKEPPNNLSENWFGALIGTFGGYRGFFDVAQSFKNAANCLIDTHKKNYFEYEILDPLLYLYRHAIELYMKALVMVYDGNCDVKKKYGHSLSKLFEQIEIIIKELGYEMPQKSKDMIDELNEIDKDSFSFRYDGDWSKDEYWIGYDNLKQDLNWLINGLEKAYYLLTQKKELFRIIENKKPLTTDIRSSLS